jgi:uncharacterized protein (TIGR00369 family)
MGLMKTIGAAEVQNLIRIGLPCAQDDGLEVVSVDRETATVRIPYHPRQLRPGDSVSGPVLMTAADAAMYALLLANGGDENEMALTSQFNCNFLARALPGDVIADARMLKRGRRMAVIQVEVRTTARDDIAAFVTGSYVLP